MKTYLNNLLNEKGINRDLHLEIEGNSGLNIIPLDVVVEAIINTNKAEQDKIRNTLVMIDFKNGDVMHFIKHLAQAIAI